MTVPPLLARCFEATLADSSNVTRQQGHEKVAAERLGGVVDLFCGAGGFSWGWHQAGLRVAAAIDRDGAAIRSHELNFGRQCPHILNRDLNEFTPQELDVRLRRSRERVVVIAGGPPCQGWSSVGRGKLRSLRDMAESLLNDPRNLLYRKFLAYTEYFQPEVCVLENVPGMLSVEGKNIADLIVANFQQVGYSCSYGIVNARWFGTPQERKRLIFLAVPQGRHDPPAISKLRRSATRFRKRLRLSSTVTVRHAIADLPEVVNGAHEDPCPYPLRTGRLSNYARLMRGGNRSLTDHIARSHNDQDLAAFNIMTQGMKYSELDDQFKRYRDDIFKDKYKRLYMDRPSWTVTAHLAKDCYTHIHPTQPRTITIREAARLQSFPDDFRFFGNVGDRYRQIGNAVPPLMAWGIAEYVKEYLRETHG